MDDEVRFTGRLTRGESGERVRSRREHAADIRALGDHRSWFGRRDFDFRSAVDAMQAKIEDWSNQGPRARFEYQKSTAPGAGNMLTRWAKRARLGGVAEGGARTRSIDVTWIRCAARSALTS